jgi:hypothetical protein
MVHQCVQGAAAGFVSVHMFVCAKVTVATLPDKRDRFHVRDIHVCQDKILALPFFDQCTGIGRKTEEI